MTEGRDLALTITADGLQCLDPKTGTVLWTHKEIAGNNFALCTRDDKVLLLVPPAGEAVVDGELARTTPVNAAETCNTHWALFACTAKEPRLVWRSPVHRWGRGDSGNQTRAALTDRYAYLPGFIRKTPVLTAASQQVHIADLATGKLVYDRNPDVAGTDRSVVGGQISAIWSDLYVTRTEADAQGMWVVRKADPQQAGPFAIWRNLRGTHHGYETVTHAAYADGFLYVRMLERGGSIRCWDLRREPGR